MVHAVVLRTNTVISNTGKGFENQHKSRSRGHGDYRSDLWTLWEYAHSENVHVDIGGHDLAQHPEE